MIRRRNDDGVIAIIVALSISTFLLGFAALAVDLGSAYLRKAELQSIADRLAVAGASGLPDIGTPEGALDRMRVQLIQICHDSRTPGLCPSDGSDPNLDWATDLDPGNGQVTFLTDPDGDGQYSLADQISATATPDQGTATALQVTLPPSTVQFGLASAIGVSTAVVHKSATARIGTPLGRGLLPFALTSQDLTNGQFCVNVGAASQNPVYPGPTTPPVGVHNETNANSGVIYGTVWQPTIQLTVATATTTLTNVQFHLTNYPDPITPDQDLGSNTYQVSVPVGDPVAVAQIWATGTLQDTASPAAPAPPFVSAEDPISYQQLPADVDTFCDQPPARSRGYLDLARSPAVGDPLPRNLRTGPDVKLYKAGTGIGALGNVGSDVHCAAVDFAVASTCVSSVVPAASFSADVTAGLLTSAAGQPGRLIGGCGNLPTPGPKGVDGTDLFSALDTGLLAPGVDGHALQADLVAAKPATSAEITSAALRCPRLAVLPVIDHGPMLGASGSVSVSAIVGFRYVWIDDTTATSTRGLNGPGSGLTSVRGYIIPGGYFPSVVSGSPEVGPYLGGDMPKEALLVHDLNTPSP